jgi:transposase-like protein
MGAPRKYPPKDAAKITEDLAALGHSIIGIAKQLGVSRETFKRWCDEDESLQEAFEIGGETERQALHRLRSLSLRYRHNCLCSLRKQEYRNKRATKRLSTL